MKHMLSKRVYEDCWLVGWFGVWFGFGPLRQYFSLYRAVFQREGERGERIDESKNVQTIPTYCKRNSPLPYCYQNCRTPLHSKFTQHHRITRPPNHFLRTTKFEIHIWTSRGCIRNAPAQSKFNKVNRKAKTAV